MNAMWRNARDELDPAVADHQRIVDESRSPFLKYRRTDSGVRRHPRGSIRRSRTARRADARHGAADAGRARTSRPSDRRVARCGASRVARPISRIRPGAWSRRRPALCRGDPGSRRCSPTRASSTRRESRSKRSAADGFATVADDVLRTFTLCGSARSRLPRAIARPPPSCTRCSSRSAACASILGTAYHGAVDRYLGLLATTLERHDDAVAHHEAALAIHERMRARPWVARSRYDLAGALVARNGPSSIVIARSGSSTTRSTPPTASA